MSAYISEKNEQIHRNANGFRDQTLLVSRKIWQFGFVFGLVGSLAIAGRDFDALMLGPVLVFFFGAAILCIAWVLKRTPHIWGVTKDFIFGVWSGAVATVLLLVLYIVVMLIRWRFIEA